MPEAPSRILIAGEREVGGKCAHCGMAIEFGQSVALCSKCGELQHETCWQLKQRCGSYECSTGSSDSNGLGASSISISRDELSAAVPMPSRKSTNGESDRQRLPSRWNKTSIWAMFLALLGIPLFGLVTGLIAIVVACIALAGHRHGNRGLVLAVVAIFIGIAEVVGWAVGMSYYIDTPQSSVALDYLTIDQDSFDDLPEHIARAMRANVVIQSSAGFGQKSLGSGVVLSVRDDVAYIVTNRHVVDSDYTDASTTLTEELSSLGKIVVSTLDNSALTGRIEWIAPGGVDLAIVSAPVRGKGVRAARWDLQTSPKVSDKVFAIGNPHGLGWTHSSGDISQIRRRTQGGYAVRILQTTAAINPGNSGGGLYDETGQLIGVNTLTGDKNWSEGLGFSIALPTLLDLAPPRLVTPKLESKASTE